MLLLWNIYVCDFVTISRRYGGITRRYEYLKSDSLQDRFKKYVVFLLLISLGWLFTNQAMNTHSHLLFGGQIITHAHPYTPDKGSHSPFQSHKHLPSVAFFLDLITSLNIDSFGFLPLYLAFLSLIALVPITRSTTPLLQYSSLSTGRAPPQLRLFS